MVIIRGGADGWGIRVKLDVQSQGDERILNVDGQGGGCIENWTILMDVICVSSLGLIQSEFKIYFCINVEDYNRVSINS